MPIDPIEIRIGNYYELNGQVIELSMEHMVKLHELLPELKPIAITGVRLSRMRFTYIGNPETREAKYQKYINGIYFNILAKKSGKMVLYINEDIKVPEVQHIHQLQNLYYDLTGDVLKREEAGKIVNQRDPGHEAGANWQRRSGPGKYRSPK